METPLSSRRVTRSQSRSSLSNSTTHITSVSKQGAKKDRSVLIDITNDSPIVGLAGKSIVSETKTPLSSVSKQRRNIPKSTPGSGEALLRGQVKTLLQKVEEEAEISRFLGSIIHPHKNPNFLGRFQSSPMGILAPTPANTPQVLGFDEQTIAVDDFAAEFPIHDHLKVSQVVSDLFDVKFRETTVDSDKSLITRSLLLDFYEKSDPSSDEKSISPLSECSSVVTDEFRKEKSSSDVNGEDDEEEDASIWSIQVNASIRDEDEDGIEDIGIEIKNEEDEGEYEDEEEVFDDDGLMDELCEGMRKISVMEEFNGKHTRFVYNSEGEIEREEEVVHLKGLPTPIGKHLRFAEDDEVCD